MGHCLFMRKGETHTAPVGGILLSDIAEGSIVKLNENGSPVEFYVAKHNYEDALNGTGRTLLVRKDCHSNQAWSSTTLNTYEGGFIDTWLNGEYKSLFSSFIQESIGETAFYYTSGGKTPSISTLSRSVFMLSLTEYGLSRTDAYVEGSPLPIAQTLQIAYLNGTEAKQMTRTRNSQATKWFFYVNSNGATNASTDGSYAVRPCFTLPSTALFDKDTLILKEVT